MLSANGMRANESRVSGIRRRNGDLALITNTTVASTPVLSYSSPQPPNAPRKRASALSSIPRLRLEEARKPEWVVLKESGRVREKFFAYTPDDVAEIDDKNTLLHIKELYFPSSQPHNAFEEAYCEIMREAVDDKL